MKKVLLSSVAALAVFAAAAPVFAEGELGANRKTNESGIYVENNEEPATVDGLKKANDKDLGDKSEKWTRDANPENPNHKGEKLVVDKGEAEAPKADENKEVAKTPAPVAGQKALPKTSAVK
ncbi:LPKTxAVK-anchored surface protein [Streptococcus parasanguinis]